MDQPSKFERQPRNYHTAEYCQNISLYKPEQSLSLSQDEGEQYWGVP